MCTKFDETIERLVGLFEAGRPEDSGHDVQAAAAALWQERHKDEIVRFEQDGTCSNCEGAVMVPITATGSRGPGSCEQCGYG